MPTSSGTQIYFVGIHERAGNVWALSLEDGSVRPLTNLTGKRGALGLWSLATDGESMYFRWDENLGDIWVMDVVTDEDQ